MSETLGAKLHSTMDAKIWAEEFMKINPPIDESTMLAWFANSIMCGWDIAHQRTVNPLQQELASVKAENEKLLADFNDVYEGSKAYFIKVTQLKLTNAALTEKLSSFDKKVGIVFSILEKYANKYKWSMVVPAFTEAQEALEKLSPDQDGE